MSRFEVPPDVEPMAADGVVENGSQPWWLAAPPVEEEVDVCRFDDVEAARDANQSASIVGFYPRKPGSLKVAGLSRDFVERLLTRYLYVHGLASGRQLARGTGLPFRLIEPLLVQLKCKMLVVHKSTAAAGDYEYILSEAGSEKARRYMTICTYAETAPVPLEDYNASIAAQSLTLEDIGMDELIAAFSDVSLEPEMLERVGPAVNAGRGMFLFGAPGNGKTSIAERIVRCFGTEMWIPRTILVDGVFVRLYDPVLHEEVIGEDSSLFGETLEDGRWIRIRRPTVVVGGELTMDQLEIRHDPVSNVCEAPLQMKSNCGVLLIDDFGRQSMPVAQLLNRWIVPLEKRYDYQKLPTGKKIQVPFDQLVVFSTNLAPRDLVDEAFLRRLPYKIEVVDPTPEQFRRIMLAVAPSLGIHPTVEQIDSLIEKYYVAAGRHMRCCHPRDLVLQVRSYCRFRRLPLEFSDAAMEFAVNNYFAIM